ncbi:MAG: alkane 1-monooxygenase [Aureispira sp.]
MWRDLKYLGAYVLPLGAAHALYMQGIWSFNGILIAFILVPFLEVFFIGTTKNLEATEEAQQNGKQLFDFLLYLNVPLLLGIAGGYFHALSTASLARYEIIGLTLTTGICFGGIGINVAHELGHRQTWFPRFMAQALLLPNLYLHFTMEHNHGHHVNIATPKDPASSRYNESVYAFWVRSVVFSYLSAWKIEARRLRQKEQSPWSWHNKMLHLQLVQLAYLGAVVVTFSWAILPYAILVAVIGFLMLETVNYIEHYGLQRRQLASGRYESVQPWHSWNCNHDIGRILLYELTRHSDHHYKASRKYQVLRHFDQAPLLPWGYPTSMLIALLPPLWFHWMNPKVEHFNQELEQRLAT